MTRRLIVGVVVMVASLVALANPTAAASLRTCKTTPGVGRECITITKAGRHFRVIVKWTYDERQDIGFRRQSRLPIGKRTLCAGRNKSDASKRCTPTTSGAELVFSADIQANVVNGLETLALPSIVEGLCSK